MCFSLQKWSVNHNKLSVASVEIFTANIEARKARNYKIVADVKFYKKQTISQVFRQNLILPCADWEIDFSPALSLGYWAEKISEKEWRRFNSFQYFCGEMTMSRLIMIQKKLKTEQVKFSFSLILCRRFSNIPRRGEIHILQDSCRRCKFCRNSADNLIFARIFQETSNLQESYQIGYFCKILHNPEGIMHGLATSCKNPEKRAFRLDYGLLKSPIMTVFIFRPKN